MTFQEAKEYMENEIRCIQRVSHCDRDCAKCELVKEEEPLLEAFRVVINALEKKIAKKPKKQEYKLLLDDGWEYACPSCGAAIGVNKKDTLDLTQHETYCPECGQKLDWSNENE